MIVNLYNDVSPTSKTKFLLLTFNDVVCYVPARGMKRMRTRY